MSTTYQADNPLPPRSGYVIALTTGTAAASTAVPSTMQGRYVTLVSNVETYILFSNTSGVTATTGVGGLSATAGVSGRIPADLPMHMRLDGEDDWVHHIGASTGVIRMWVSSPP